jgi:hypothetical protein
MLVGAAVTIAVTALSYTVVLVSWQMGWSAVGLLPPIFIFAILFVFGVAGAMLGQIGIFIAMFPEILRVRSRRDFMALQDEIVLRCINAGASWLRYYEDPGGKVVIESSESIEPTLHYFFYSRVSRYWPTLAPAVRSWRDALSITPLPNCYQCRWPMTLPMTLLALGGDI